MLDANFWQDKNNSKNIIKEKKLYEDLTNTFVDSIKKIKDLDDLNELALEENNLIVQKEILYNVKELRKSVKPRLLLYGTFHCRTFLGRS